MSSPCWGLRSIPFSAINTKAVRPTIAVTSPRGQDSAWPRTTIQARMKGAAAAASSSQRAIGKVSQALQLELPTPHAQLAGSLPLCTTLGSVESENHSRNRLITSTVAATIPMISERSSLEVSMGRPYPTSNRLRLPAHRHQSGCACRRTLAYAWVAVVTQRWGLTVPLTGLSLPDNEDLVRRAEAAGYTDLWSGETNGPDGFTPLGLSAAWTERVRLGTGIVGVFQRGPALLAQEAAALADASGGRFALGIGSSSDRIVEGWNGIPFERPLTKVRETLEYLRTALEGERAPGGFKLETAPAQRVPIVLAALRGRMLELAVERADGAFTNF